MSVFPCRYLGRFVCRVEGVLPTIVEDGSAECPCGSGQTFSQCHGAFA
ncbi:hypothetical protein FGA82_22140 [Pseudomonas fluorescens]|nr:hypothetical protein FGA82_22140 [Pseudomonas fluorescens]